MPGGTGRQWPYHVHHQHLLNMKFSLREPFAALLVTALLAAGCDYVDKPKEVVEPNDNGPTETVTRNVLLEDFTGHKCNNCPQANSIAAQLISIYGERFVAIGIHSGHFAVPELPLGDGRYDTDFRTPDGNIYHDTFGPQSYPQGMISRVPFQNSTMIGRTNWSSATAQLINTTADLKIWCENYSYSPGTNNVQVTVKVAAQRAITGDLNLTLLVTEDHVIDWQLDGVVDIPAYDHKHILRGAVNSTWGQALVSGSAAVGDTLEQTINFQLPANVLQPANCNLVAYVYRTDDRQVLQVIEKRVPA